MRTCCKRYFTIIAIILIHLMCDFEANAKITAKRRPSERKSSLNGIDSKLIARKRRYVTFPEGSSLGVVFCLTTATPIMGDIFTHGIGFGSSYDLPNETNYLSSESQPHYEPEYIIIPQRRRDRRSIYQQIEVVLDSMGLPGHVCMLRMLCEASDRLASRRGLLEELLRVILTIPQMKSRRDREREDFFGDEWNYTFDSNRELFDHYDEAFHLGQRDYRVDCSLYFPDCEVSVLDTILPG